MVFVQLTGCFLPFLNFHLKGSKQIVGQCSAGEGGEGGRGEGWGEKGRESRNRKGGGERKGANGSERKGGKGRERVKYGFTCEVQLNMNHWKAMMSQLIMLHGIHFTAVLHSHNNAS